VITPQDRERNNNSVAKERHPRESVDPVFQGANVIAEALGYWVARLRGR
jgi:hypothetical protein